MALLEYLNHTVPDVVKKSVNSFFFQDPAMDAMRKRGNIKRNGGSLVRFKRIKSGHSDVSEISGANLSVNLAKRETFDTMTGDWGRYIKPIVIPHLDMDRMENAAQKKQFIQETSQACIQSFKNDVVKRWYLGNAATAAVTPMIGSLNGGLAATPGANGTANGFRFGALVFDVPATQDSTAGLTYMNLDRRQDAVRDEDNWHNQFKAHAGIGTDFLETVEEIKMVADSYCDDNEGISMGVLGHVEHVQLGKEIRTLGGRAGGGLMYTPTDLDKGFAQKAIHVAGGIAYHSNRFITAARLSVGGGAALTGACYLLNPNTLEFWINAGHDFNVTKFTNHMEHGNQAADIAYCVLEAQYCVRELLTQGCTRQA